MKRSGKWTNLRCRHILRRAAAWAGHAAALAVLSLALAAAGRAQPMPQAEDGAGGAAARVLDTQPDLLAETLVVGVRAHLGEAAARQRWQPTIDALNEGINGARFVLRTYDSPDSIVAGAERDEFDYVITDPGTFVEMDVRHGVEERLSLANVWKGQPLDRFGSVIFVGKSRADVQSLQDLRGLRLMAVAPHAFGGWEMALKEFLDAGIRPGRFFRAIEFAGGNQQDVVFAVRDGRADVGVVRTGTLERMAEAGLIDMDDFRAVAPRKMPGFPFLLSTDLYPEWVFAVHPGAPDRITQQVVRILSEIGPGHPAVADGQYYSWETALNYWPVHLLLRQLRAPPYETFGDKSFVAVLWDNRMWLVMGAALIVFTIAALAIAVRQGVRMARTRGELLTRQTSELAFRQRAIDAHAIVSVTDAQGRMIYVNDKFMELTGYSCEDLIGRKHNILKSGFHSPEFYADLWNTIRRGETWTGEVKNRRKDGSFYWVQSTIVPQRDSDGRIVKFIAIQTDTTETKLAQTEMNLQQFLEGVPDEVFKLRPGSFEVISANSRALRAAGMSLEELKQRTFFDLFDPEDAARLACKLEELSLGCSDAADLQLERIAPDGRRLASHVHVQLFRPEGAEPRFIVTLRDVSGYSEALDTVGLLKATLDEMAEEIYMFWPDTRRFFYVNKAARERIGMSEDELYRLTPMDLEGGPTAEEYERAIQPLVTGERKRMTYRREVEVAPGRSRIIEFDLKYIESDGHRPRFMAILTDVTRQARAEEEVRQLKATLDLIRNEVYVFWPDSYQFLYLNRAALDRVGWGESEWHGRHTWEYITPKQQEVLEEKCRTLLKGPERSMVFETVDRNGTPLEIYLHLIEPEGEKPRFLSVYQDITERKQAEIAKAQFISTVSHELRTPLTSIKGSLGLLKAGVAGGDPAKMAAMIDIAYSNTERLRNLVNDILDWEKIEAGQMSYHKEPVDLADLVGKAVLADQGFAAEHGVEFRLDLPDTPVMCNLDHGRIAQVVANLLSNAAKFAGERKVVDVTVEARGGQARVSVRDYGIGIPVEAQATIFERFTQADSSDVRKKGGTGLGLSISKAIVEAHGGTIDFVSAEGRGTTFFFDLPLLGGDGPDGTGQDPCEDLPRERRPHVLVCEGDPDAAIVLWLGLERAGCRASVAPSAEHARRMLTQAKFQGMTVDVGLPGGAGVKLLDELRRDPDTAGLSVAAVGAAVDEDREELTGSAFEILDWIRAGDQAEPQLKERIAQALKRLGGEGRRILLASRHSRLDEALAGAAGAGDRIERAQSAAKLEARLAEARPDLVVLDLALSRNGGADLFAALAALDEPLPLLVVAWAGEDGPAVKGEAVAAVMRNRKVEWQQLTRSILKALRCHGRTAFLGNMEEPADA